MEEGKHFERAAQIAPHAASLLLGCMEQRAPDTYQEWMPGGDLQSSLKPKCWVTNKPRWGGIQGSSSVIGHLPWGL